MVLSKRVRVGDMQGKYLNKYLFDLIVIKFAYWILVPTLVIASLVLGDLNWNVVDVTDTVKTRAVAWLQLWIQ